jgi:hypothetical protein
MLKECKEDADFGFNAFLDQHTYLSSFYKQAAYYGWTGQRSGSGVFDIAGATLGVFASLDRL